MICPASKQPVSLRISVTDRCQFRCRYCMPESGVPMHRHRDILSFEEITALVGRLGTAFDVTKARFTGGDPLARRNISQLVAALARQGIADLAMTTNGQGLAQAAPELRAAGLHRVNISLDSLDPRTFARITRGGNMRKTVDGIGAALRAGLRPVKLNMVVMRGINDHEISDVLDFALERGCELRFLELMPVGYGAALFKSAYMPMEHVRQGLAERFTLEPGPVEPGSSARRFRACRSDGLSGIVGFISPCSDPFCGDCTRMRLTADGRLMGCLARQESIPIRPLLAAGDDDALVAAVQRALRRKRLNGQIEQPAGMGTFGG